MELTKRLVLILFCAFAARAASVANLAVQISNTQAILSWDAVDYIGSCAVTVSESASMTPVVHDVDETLFTASSSDARFPRLRAGQHRTFVVGTRTVQVGNDGHNYSRALQADTIHYVTVTCGTATATISFRTATIPYGASFGEQPVVNPAHDGTYLYPTWLIDTGGLTARTSALNRVIEPHTGLLTKPFTLSTDPNAAGTVNMGSSGWPDMCYPQTVSLNDGTPGYQCVHQFLTGTSSSGLYWVNPATGDSRFLTYLTAQYGPPDIGYAGHYFGALAPPMDFTAGGNTFYTQLSSSVDTTGLTWVFFKGTYTGHSVAGQDSDHTGLNWSTTTPATTLHFASSPTNPNSCGADPNDLSVCMLEPWTRDIKTLIAELNPAMANICQLTGDNHGGAIETPGNGIIVLRCFTSQDDPGWIAVFDVNRTAAQQTTKLGSAAGCIDNPAVASGTNIAGKTGCFIAVTGTLQSGAESPLRFATLHQLAVLRATANFGSIYISTNTLRNKLGNAYQVTLSSAIHSASGDPTTGDWGPCTMTQPVGNNLRNWPTSSSWADGCTYATVTGLSSTWSGTSSALFPANITIHEGDVIITNSSMASPQKEPMRILNIDPDGHTLYLQRSYGYGSSQLGANGHMEIASGTAMDMMPDAIYPDTNNTGLAAMWWDFNNGPLVTNQQTVYIDPEPVVHNTAQNAISCTGSDCPKDNRWTWADYAQGGGEFARLTNVPFANSVPTPSIFFQSGLAAPYKFANTANQLESHPNLSVTTGTAFAFNQLIDVHPFFGNPPTPLLAATLASGATQVYKIPATGSVVATDYKWMTWIGTSGWHAMSELSGPSVILTDANAYQWCVVLFAGECYTGSAVGEIYFNAPSVALLTCDKSWSQNIGDGGGINAIRDICISPLTADFQAIKTQDMVADPLGSRSRVLSNAFLWPKLDSIFHNARMLPDGSWGFTMFEDSQLHLFKIPVRHIDSINRAAYVPVDVTVQAGVASNAVVEFGYAENGTPASGQLYCTARQENCVAQSATVTQASPFLWATTETHTGMSCSSGCTIKVPGISGRVLWYRTNNAALTAPGPLQTTVVP